MIDEIQVRDLALVSNATFEPGAGLTVLTGETGAGKTALLNALKLLMGERADKNMVRDGASELSVFGRFFGISADNEAFEGASDEYVAVRRVSAEGRSRVQLNGEMASVKELADIIGTSIDLCGQHEHQQLLKTSSHLHFLDAWIGADAECALAVYQDAFRAAHAAQEELERVEAAARVGQAQLDEARFILQRIDEVDPRMDEYDELVAGLARAEHAEALATAAHTAYEAITREDGALDQIDQAVGALEACAQYDGKLRDFAAQLREAAVSIEDAAGQTRTYRDSVEFDADELVEKQNRLSAIQGLMRIYGPRLQDVLETRERAQEQVSLVDDAELRIAEATRDRDAAEAALVQAAQALAAIRSDAAPGFSDAVSAQMVRLEMGSARLVCAVDDLPRDQWTQHGSQTVEFLFSAGADLTPHSLSRIASGGEISRVMLALKVVLGAQDTVDTLVFDEVDAGVGGVAANALADVLVDLARSHQVIVVTHLAQIAAKGGTHYLVSKTDGPAPETELHLLSAGERPAEIARMLSGEVTDVALAHARELLGIA